MGLTRTEQLLSKQNTMKEESREYFELESMESVIKAGQFFLKDFFRLLILVSFLFFTLVDIPLVTFLF